ncbi:hypothetical protein ABNX05_11510 [Lysinibacillus sp. M3]|uniref:Uncharacterized protein n=1 Tax=Lysinibacillus zambalensis TaxID=3160866 RepID=A0ABV1MRX3_9BACI
MKEILSIKPISLELNESNDIYMLLNIGILSNVANYNDAQFTDEFIEYIVSNKVTYIGLPLQVNKEKLENAEYDNLTHELVNGKLMTDSIGSFVDFWTETIDDATVLMGSVKIWKRYPNTCSAILELYENGDLESSCEVMIKEYKEITEDGIRIIDHADGSNAFIGSAIVSNPAESRAKATLLVAEAYEKDLSIENEEKGDVTVAEKEVFNKGHKIQYKGKFETASLKYSEISNQIYNKLNPINAKTNGRQYNYYIHTIFNDHVIVEDWDDYEVLFKIPYSIENDEVIISPSDQWEQGKLGFIPDNTVELTNLLSEKEKELSDVQDELTQVKEELASLQNDETKEASDFKDKIKELNDTIVTQAGTESELRNEIAELKSTVEELVQYKEKVEIAEKETEITELSNKYSKLLSEETFKSDDVQNAIQELNSEKLNEIVVNEVTKQKNEVEVASKQNDDVIVVASKQDDLIVKDKREFWASPRS